MKKTNIKLPLRKETLRTLVNAELTRPLAGHGTDVPLLATESKDKQCPLTIAADR